MRLIPKRSDPFGTGKFNFCIAQFTLMQAEAGVPDKPAVKNTVLITGASSGVGKAASLLFASRGWNVVANGRNGERLRQLVADCQSSGLSGKLRPIARDLATPDAGPEIVRQAVDAFGSVNAIVHAAATAVQGSFADITPEQFDTTVDLNLRGTYFLLQAAFRQMIVQGGGTIVSISSLAAIDPFTGFSVYGSSKAWLDLLTRAIADEGRQHGIRAFSIRPGAVETPMLRKLFPDFPAEKTVTPEAVAEMAWSLAGPTWIHSSGQAINVSAQ